VGVNRNFRKRVRTGARKREIQQREREGRSGGKGLNMRKKVAEKKVKRKKTFFQKASRQTTLKGRAAEATRRKRVVPIVQKRLTES